ncbi:TldD/PmbA family protein [Roseovarius amoyensis]|uniref:TldD/PmbA family protein n=1 Tax=Roseovarius amoyensis TaxID=2211448 RepID=UPI000DBE3A36|nr:TldD/PmbA family protein [Roseovarius amoyensis]
MSEPLEHITEALISAALKAGAGAADAMAVEGRALTIGVRSGTLEDAERAEGTDIGLRVLIGGRQACVSASDTRPETIAALAERAVAMAREAPEDPHAGLAEPEQTGIGCDLATLELADPASEPAPADLQQAALAAEAAAQAVKGVSQVQSATAAWSRRSIHMAASNGFSGVIERTDSALSCTAIAGSGTGMQRDSDGDMRIFRTDLRDAREIGQRAGERAVAMLGAKKPPTGAFPVVFDERVAATLIGHLLAAANGASVARGVSWLRGRLGEAVLPEALSLTEDPHRPRVGASRPFDAEGLPTRTRALVDGGVLTGWLLDLSSARQLGMTPTANARRGPSAPPSPAAWNVALTQGTQSRDDLLREMGTGLLITSMIGSTINPNTGDYSRGASGFWVEGGEIAYPVQECTIAGGLPEMLRTIQPANDARPWLSRVVPSLLVEGLTLAGD